MNEDYLWDRSGEPDREVQELENVLGTLRYQPRPLEIPERTFRGHKTFVLRSLAIAAVVALVAFGLGLWISMQRPQTQQAATTEERSNTPVMKPAVEDRAAESNVDEQKVKNLQLASFPARPKPHNRPRRASMSATEVAQARLAKDQLMLALRLASSKLSFVQKKTQPESVHNQHKIG